jgi:adenosine deaminase
MLNAGLNVIISTDDPSISQITLSDEYQRACEDLGMEHKQLKERILAAAQASFLPKAEREALMEQLRTELAKGVFDGS